ncbi:hypothetical protein EDB85DRAFT_2277695 [Lactarius pseudohatsudake]|nr:hypothetical protein EDB85DRAFT_2277695 [Lactarius pseudohatsudake]
MSRNWMDEVKLKCTKEASVASICEGMTTRLNSNSPGNETTIEGRASSDKIYEWSSDWSLVVSDIGGVPWAVWALGFLASEIRCILHGIGHNCATPAWKRPGWTAGNNRCSHRRCTVSQEESLRLPMRLWEEVADACAPDAVLPPVSLSSAFEEKGLLFGVMRACPFHNSTGLRNAEDVSWGTKSMRCRSSASRPACATCLRGADVPLGVDPTQALKAFVALREWLAGRACQVEIGAQFESRTLNKAYSDSDVPHAAFLSYKAPGAEARSAISALRYFLSLVRFADLHFTDLDGDLRRFILYSHDDAPALVQHRLAYGRGYGIIGRNASGVGKSTLLQYMTLVGDPVVGL